MVALGTFANTLPGDFVYDDVLLIQDSVELKRFDLNRIFLQNYWGSERVDRNYRPLTLLTHALNYQLTESAWGFHLVNVILNALVAWLAFLVLLELGVAASLAALLASIYAVLPIHTEAVANIVGRAELLGALAVLGAWLAALKCQPGQTTRWAVAAGCITLAGLAAKEHVLTVTPVIILGAWLTGRRVPWRVVAATTGASVIYLAIRTAVIGSKSDFIAATDNPLIAVDVLTRALNGIALLGLYVGKILAPVHLSASYSFNQLPVRPLSDWGLWVLVVPWLILPAGCYWLWKQGKRLAALAPVFFLVTFSTTANVLVPIGTMFGERLAFLPSFAFVLLLGGILSGSKLARWFRPALVVLTALLLVYAGRTMVRNRDWSDRLTMYLRMPLDAPRSAASHFKASEAHIEAAMNAAPATRAVLLSNAEAAIRRSIAIDPDSGKGEAKLAEILHLAGKDQEAIQAFDRALPLLRQNQQTEAVVFFLRGKCLLALRRIEESRADFDTYLKVLEGLGAPPSAIGFNYRGLTTGLLGRFAEALPDFNRALELEQTWPELWNNRGMCKFSLQDVPGAIADWRRGLELCRRAGLPPAPGKDSVYSFLVKLANAHEALAISEQAAGNAEAALGATAEAQRLRQEAARAAPPSP